MSILSTLRGWLSERQREAYARDFGNATPEEAAEIKERSVGWRNRLRQESSDGMPYGAEISPTGTPIDYTADQKPPKY